MLEAKAVCGHTCIAGGLFKAAIQKKQGSFTAPLEFKIFHYMAGTLPKIVSYLNIVYVSQIEKSMIFEIFALNDSI